MAARVYQDRLELAVGSLEALPFEGALPGCFPYPLLRPSEPLAPRFFQTVVLENEFLRATLLPELGGRIVSIWDKRTGKECVSTGASLSFEASGTRGVWIPEGIQWEIGEPKPRGSMAETDVQIRVEREDGSAQIVLFELVSGLPLSWHLWLTLPSDKARLEVEVRALNRSFSPLPYSCGFTYRCPGGRDMAGATAFAAFSSEREAGCAFAFDEGALDRFESDGMDFRSRRFLPEGALWPRQTDHWKFDIVPVSGEGSWSAFGSVGALEVQERELRFQAAESVPAGKVFLLAGDGTLEADVELAPGRTTALPTTELPQAVLLRSSDRRELLRWPMTVMEPVEPPSSCLSSEPVGVRALRDPRLRSGALSNMAIEAHKTGDLARADELLEEALLFNGDDPLAWAFKGAIQRELGSAEGPEFPSAHYLAPLEPLLRAEAFLGTPAGVSSEPSPLVARLAEQPDYLAECACMLLEQGRHAEADRFLNEALRHVDHAALRVLAAWNLMKNSKAAAEAAMHLQAAKLSRGKPPFPWRPFQRRVYEELAAAFPAETWLGQALQEYFPASAGS
jgi:tetratricopeptide (TPR) repeat protein